MIPTVFWASLAPSPRLNRADDSNGPSRNKRSTLQGGQERKIQAVMIEKDRLPVFPIPLHTYSRGDVAESFSDNFYHSPNTIRRSRKSVDFDAGAGCFHQINHIIHAVDKCLNVLKVEGRHKDVIKQPEDFMGDRVGIIFHVFGPFGQLQPPWEFFLSGIVKQCVGLPQLRFRLKPLHEFFQWGAIDVPDAVKRVIKVLDDHIEEVNRNCEGCEHEHMGEGALNAQ